VKNCCNRPRERPASQRVVKVQSAGADAPPSAVGGPRACPWRDQTHASSRGDPCTPRVPGRMTGFQSGTVAISGPQGAGRCDGVEPGHTPRPRVGRRVRMLLSFQRPSHLSGRGFLPTAHPEPFRFRSGPVSIAPAPPSWEVSGRGRHCRTARPRVRPGYVGPPWPRAGSAGYETTWTVTVRCRGRSSKSISTSCCHVPSVRRPSTTGIVSDGPMTAARRWAWALVS
jgi:hypothetical protein